jgi:hypothetical protein
LIGALIISASATRTIGLWYTYLKWRQIAHDSDN